MQPVPFDNSYASLPEKFFSRQEPIPVDRPGPIRVNRELARELGIDADWLASDEGTLAMAGNTLPDGAQPIATVYAGHQFGSYNPQLGDGRAVLLGEVVAPGGRRYDIQLKGSGPTPYSRGGDGRAPLGPVLREYVVSEAMYHLGVPTTRALAAVTTGEMVAREQMLPGAVLARVASSHIRVGTVQFFAAHRDSEALQALADHVIERHFPGVRERENPMLGLLEEVIARQAALIAHWQLLGFIHGVMNTDNMLLCGETIDYGPCAFMDQFNPEQVYSSIDHGGRYAYRNQPGIAHWNLSCLAQALLPLLHPDQDRAVELAQAAIDDFPGQFLDAHSTGLARKLGLTALEEEDTALVEELFNLMAQHELDFTLTFRQLADLADEQGGGARISDDFELPEVLSPWIARWRQRLERDTQRPPERQAAMYRANPAFIPRNHRVEEAIVAATRKGDFEPFHALVDTLEDPWTYRPDARDYATPPRPEEVVRQTFCGT
ncbi:MAG: YdiU family protein [Halioglobus sp.]|nr:YdiU family protein [Halioglobus sp.]